MRTVVVVPHTHWDREWYDTVDAFRPRLVAVLDAVLDALESDGAIRCFLLDGQLAVVDDYLAVRPDHRPRLAALVAAGRLMVGPWYVLADELLATDEVLVRNLQLGGRMGMALGGWMSLGYSPDAFGHPAALPTILAGFGITRAIVWRGYGRPGQRHDLFRWIGPDGSAVLTHHLPPSGYDSGEDLPTDPSRLARRWERLRRGLLERATANVLLVMNGADHHALQPDIGRVVASLNEIDAECDVRIGSPVGYFDALPPDPDVPDVCGELRDSYGYAWTLQGVHASRSRLKQAIAAAERTLVRWTEPQCALGGTDQRQLVWDIWRRHLQSCAHDSFGGCCSDDVARDVAARTAAVTTEARVLLADAVHARLGQDRTRSRRHPERWQPTLAVINPSPWERGGVVEATVCVFRRHIPVGPPRGEPTRPEADASSSRAVGIASFDGSALPVQVLESYVGYDRLEAPNLYPDQDEVTAVRVVVQVPHVPPLGVRCVRLAGPTAAAPRPDDAVTARARTAESSWCRVTGDGPGGFRVSRGRELWRRFGDLVSERDGGDTYTFQPVASDRPRRARWGPSRACWPGPLAASIARDFEVTGRSRGTAYLRLDAGSRIVRLVVEGHNLAGDHRLRVTFPLPATSGRTVADMQFGPVTRDVWRDDGRRYAMEWPVTTAPMHRYVSVAGAGGTGVTVFSRGLFEYEPTDDGRLAVTIHRSVGQLSRGGLPARPGHAGWPVATPGAQELGPFRVELGVAFAAAAEPGAPSAWHRLERLAEEFHASLAGMMLRYAIDPPETVPGPALLGEGLVFKALKTAECGDAMVLRCVNVTRQPVRGVCRWPVPMSKAAKARLDETPIEWLDVVASPRQVEFEASPREVVTLLVWP